MADAPHLLKNLYLIHCLIMGPSNYLQLFKKKYKLSSDCVEQQHLEDLLQFQEESELKLAPKIRDYILHPKGFEKMKVGVATSLFNADTVHALQYLAFENRRPEYNTTAWFINMVSQYGGLL